MKLGFVSIDTSHPDAWIPIERDFGCEVVGFWDPGDIHPPDFADAFAARHSLRRFATLEELVPELDAVIIHSCNWDRHLEQAEPFFRAGKAVFIDKPMVGNRRDIETLLNWAKAGARVTGGSCFFYCPEIEQWRAEAGGIRPHTLFAGCAVDDFNYAIHAYSMAATVFGPGMLRARFLGRSVQQRVQLEWEGGECAFLSIGAQESWLQAHLTLVTASSALQIRPGANQLYDGYVKRSLAYLFGREEDPLVPLEALLECERAALAVLQSERNGGSWVELAELDGPGLSFDGAAFVREYRRQKYPEAK